MNRCENTKLREIYAEIRDLLDSGEIREIRSKDDKDARFGHKTVKQTFFGYKTHMAMSEERIITAIEVTPGGEPDGKQLPVLPTGTVSLRHMRIYSGLLPATRTLKLSEILFRMKVMWCSN